MTTDVEGRLSGDRTASHDWLATVFDPVTEQLRIDRRGPFWEAVDAGVQRALINPPPRRTVAVVDSGFDLSIRRLAEAVHPDSQVPARNTRQHGRHGTAVALLINEIAPDARLLLIDVMPNGRLWKQAVADGLRQTAASGADIVNLSLEFPTTAAPRRLESTPHSVLDAYSSQAVVDDVGRFFRAVDAYATDGCPRQCAVCDAIRELPPHVVVFAASGNLATYACPACTRRSVGVAFHAQSLFDAGGMVVLAEDLDDVPSNLAWEAAVPVPPGMNGTSFAAPLLAGLAAITDDPVAFGDIARFPFALSPTSIVGDRARRAINAPAELIDAWAAGLDAFATHIPTPHRHWSEGDPAPCPTCAFGLMDFYHQVTCLRMALGNFDHAIAIARTATALAPTSPMAAGNLALACLAAGSQAPTPDGDATLIESALRQAMRATLLAPHVTTYRATVAAARAQLAS